VYASTRPLEEKIAYCERAYGEAGLPALFRLTPFSEPPGLDEALERRGYGRFEETAVESASLSAVSKPRAVIDLPLDEWVQAIGALRGSTAAQRAGHLARLRVLPLPARPVALLRDEAIVATGLVVVEGSCAGLFDILTAESARRQGHARSIVTGLLAIAWELGARSAYLQVKADNTAARDLYRQFGFEERYQYWYRGREGERE
jgi:N-acetylglutamate synthase